MTSKTKLRSFGTEGIRFSEDYFTEDFVRKLLRPRPSIKAPAAAGPKPAPAKVVPMDAEGAHSEGWKEILDHDDLKAVIETEDYTEKESLEHFEWLLTQDPEPETMDEQPIESFSALYTRKFEDGKYVHMFEGDTILVIPETVAGASELSDVADVVLYGMFVVIDVAMMICALCQVIVSIADKKGLVLRMGPPIVVLIDELSHPYYVHLLKQLKKQGKRAEAAMVVCEHLATTESTDTTDVYEKILEAVREYLTPLQIVQTVCWMIAMILMTVGTAGAAIVARIAMLIRSLAVLAIDLDKFIDAVDELSEGDPGNGDDDDWPDDVPEDGTYIGNRNTHEIHNPLHITASCHFDMIREDHKVIFGSVEEMMNAIDDDGYNGCHWCMPDFDTG